MARHVAVRVLVGLASLAIVLALLAGYVQRSVVDSDAFADRATQALHDDSVRALITREITDQVVLRQEADLIAARPIIQSVASDVVGGGAFRGLFRSGVRQLHRALFAGDAHRLTLTVDDVGTVLAAALDVIRPKLGDRVRKASTIPLITRDIGTAGATAVRIGDTIKLLAPLLFAVAVLLSALALWLSEERRRTVVWLGGGVAAGAVLLLIGLGIARSAAIGQLHAIDDRAAASAIWDAFLGDLRTAAWILAAAGAVVAASAASLIRPVDLGEPLRWLGARLRALPPTRTVRALRGVALAGLGILLIVARATVLRIVFDIAGVYLIYEGVTAILWLVYEPPVRRRRRHPEREREARVIAEHRRPLVAGFVALVLVGLGAAAYADSGYAPKPAPVVTACNGHEELCDRPLARVALAATHNSMSVPLPGWYAAEQDAPIAAQLHDGIRGLLIDTHYADRLANGRLRTVTDGAKIKAEVEAGGISPDTVDAALRLRKQIGFSGKGERGMYLCHTFCELGGTALSSVLADLHDFLAANPGEVVVVINEDYVTPADFVGAVKKAGLADEAYAGPITATHPTLREMIDHHKQVLFLAEKEPGAAPWYRSAYDAITQETPFAFRRAAQLTDPAELDASCAPNRGLSSAPLFLVNHWVSTDPLPLPSNAARVNARGPLLARLRDCERIRHRVPNLVAVNYYRRGDVMAAIDAINGVG